MVWSPIKFIGDISDDAGSTGSATAGFVGNSFVRSCSAGSTGSAAGVRVSIGLLSSAAAVCSCLFSVPHSVLHSVLLYISRPCACLLIGLKCSHI